MDRQVVNSAITMTLYFNTETRDTLEQIDVARSLIDTYPDTFQYALSSEEIITAITDGKIASMLGVEGGHQLGNSFSVLRQYYHLGARYVTLTHTCHNAFADSSAPSTPLHNGLRYACVVVHSFWLPSRL
jgi:membrane dipeptidase